MPLQQQLRAEMGTAENLIVVDLREPGFYRAGHIAGARNIPFEQFQQRMIELKGSDRIVLVCHTGQMGDASGALLVQNGYSDVSNLQGGMAAWDGGLEK